MVIHFKLNFPLLDGIDKYKKIASMLQMLQSKSKSKSCPKLKSISLVAFSNGLRIYVLRVLRELGLDAIFPPNKVFAVDYVLPYCKPEKEAFDIVLNAVGVKDASEFIMIEDSLENIRAAKGIGMVRFLVSSFNTVRFQVRSVKIQNNN